MRETEIVIRDGVWWADYRDRRGKRHRFSLKIPGSVPFKNAYKIFDDVRKEREMQRFELRKALDDVVEFKEGQVDWKTLRLYRETWEQLVSHLEAAGVKHTSDITPDHMAEWSRTLMRTVKPGTVNTKLVVAGTLFKIWHTLGRMPQFVSSRFISPFRARKVRKRERIFSTVELSRLFADPDFGHIYEFLYLSIQRIDVVLQLHSSNVNLDRGIISFPRGKGGKLQDIPLTAQLRDWFERHGREGYLFCSDQCAVNWYSRRKLTDKIRVRLHKILSDEGWEPGRIHDFRATGASALAALVPMPVLMQYGGWDTASVCLRYYRTKPEDLQIPDLPLFRQNGQDLVMFAKRKSAKD